MDNSNIKSALEPLQVLVESGKIDEALAWLSNNQVKFDPVIYNYNLGHLLFQKGDFVNARIHVENSIKNGFLTPESRKLLKSINDNLGVNELEKLESISDYYYYALKSSFGTWQVTSMLLITLISLSLVYYKSQSFKKTWFALIIILAMFSPIVYTYNTAQVGIVKSNIILREGPSQVFNVQTEVPAGLKIIYEKHAGGWKKILYPSVFDGWIKVEQIEQLEKI